MAPSGTTAGQPVFTPIAHPVLRRYGRKAIHTFIREREQYLLRIADATASGATVSPISIKSSIEPDLLLSLVEFGEFDGVTAVHGLTEDILEAWLQDKDATSLDSLTLLDLEAAVKAFVRINVHEEDPEMRIKSLFLDYKTFLRQRKLDSLVTDNPKLATAHIVSLLKPPALKAKIEKDLALSKHELRKQWIPFFKHVTEQAIACDSFVSVKPSGEGNTKQSPTHKKDSAGFMTRLSSATTSRDKYARLPDEKCGAGSMSQPGDTPNTSRTKSVLRNPDTRQLPLCLNVDECKEHHLLKNCPVTSEIKKEALLKEFYAKKSRKGQLSILATTPETVYALQGTGRYFAKLADTVQVIVNGDYGADHCALSQDHLRSCADKGIYVQVLPLSSPISMQLAMSGENREPITVHAEKKARISTTLDTPEGPFRLRNVEYLVFKKHMPEVLLSRPLLQSLGFNLDKHLASVRHRFHDTDFSNIGFSPQIPSDTSSHPGQLSHLLLQPDIDASTSQELPLDDTGDDLSACTVDVSSDSPVKDDGTLPQAMFGDAPSDDPISLEDDVSVGTEHSADTHKELDLRCQEASSNGLSESQTQELRALLTEFHDIFRTTLGSEPPMKVPPMKIKLKDDAVPIRVKVRRYSPPQADFLRKKVDQLLDLGLIVRNNTSQWASAPLIVPKAGPERFRFTVDLRPINSQTIPHVWPMPSLEAMTLELAGDTCYATIDLCNGYWQMPLHPDSRECQSFITPDGVFSPTRVLHGQTNAVAFFQSSLQQLLLPLRDKILQWLDDLLFHCKDFNELLCGLRSFFEICRASHIKLHARKCKFFMKHVSWCGRLISQEGIRFDPRNFAALLEMQEPVTGADLQQFLCAVNWMRSAIPEFTKLIAPLAALMETVYTEAGGRTKKAVLRISLKQNLWDEEHSESFKTVKNALHNVATLAHPDSNKVLCLFTDASDLHWSGVLTQIPRSDLDEPFDQQHHEPLSFLAGSFKGSRSRWSTAEKEAFAVVESAIRLDYILLRPEGFFLFTDHRNLTYIFNPISVSPGISKMVANKIERWALKLSSFRYTIVHISGEENCWADLLSRWAFPLQPPARRISALLRAPLAPDLDPEFRWPSPREFKEAQEVAISEGREKPLGTLVSGLYKDMDGSVWIPSRSVSLQLRLCIIGHCGRGGHRGSGTTFENIRTHFKWSGMETDIATFCNTCLHCAAASTGKRVPRQMGHAIHADKPNEVIHFDFLYMGNSTTGPTYVLIIKDDCSSFIWLEPCESIDAETAAKTLLKWFSLFGVVSTWVSDRGSHFKNKVMERLNRQLHAHHHFTTPYCPQSNGTVETVCKEVLRAVRALLSEFRLKEKEWPEVLPLLQSILNHSVRPSLNNEAPITVFTGLPADNPLRTLIQPGSMNVSSIDVVKAQKIINFKKMQGSLEKMHKQVAESRTRRREQAVERHNKKTHIQPINFELGDFVLVAKRVSSDGHKLQVRWKGPKRISRVVSDFVFEVQDLIDQSHALVHANRLKLYADSQLELTEELLDSIDHNDPHYNTVEELLALRFYGPLERYEVQVKWKGFDDEEPTWEPLSVMQEDIPVMLKKFLEDYHDKNLVQAALSE